ncbi:hypothetical protein Desdi_3489 [Desulfitobacterium dichloroeliminans LMG P-21439]|uniref:rRNA (pseudouridine-N3-)-methyltransferase RlmH n=1 Tax=Desulfitobacterium dichloroeliminans (strain LMG P-21439 / DCA1) TaxID=871963 RepID=L0FCZ3_DESDL|nr:23S rRNA (pseudouridine(1915)-N(3))-methyltransferase RlmH [Desulfitobacterium dichloroeliminans]AGA70875.1 hypothetical protein Desdi_3489 [Desulfitobacterium dichloroeliminans LMG P-21439]
MNFRIYLPNNKIENFYRDAIKEYEKRLGRYCKIQVVRYKSDEQLIKLIPDKAHRLLISVNGEKITSEGLASKISEWGLSGIADIAIIIGTTLPHDEVLALSSAEMALGLQATVLYEQIYRSYRIINNQPYHK